MAKIIVTKFLETSQLLSADKGTRLSQKIIEELKKASSIELDFTGYSSIGSSFINRAFGDTCIQLELTPEEFTKKIKLVNLDDDDKDDVLLSLYNALNKLQIIKSGKDIHEYYSSTLSY